jgi:serine/threonine-protein kinase
MALVHVIQGLSSIHDAGGFHRDIKPDNLLVTSHPQEPGKVIIKVSDFGLARMPELSGTPMTRRAGGTEGYIAPEVLAGAPFSSSADIYSLGVTATELLTGQRGVKALGQTKMPEQLRGLIRKMLSDDPLARPDAQQVATVLGELLANPDAAIAEEADESNFGAFLFGSLLFSGALLALAALAGGEKPGHGAGGAGSPAGGVKGVGGAK